MTSFEDLKKDPSHPFWAFVDQMNNENNGASSSREQANFPAEQWNSNEEPRSGPQDASDSDQTRPSPSPWTGPDGERRQQPPQESEPQGRHHHHRHEHRGGHRGGFGGRGRGGPMGGGPWGRRCGGPGGRFPFTQGFGMPGGPPPFGGAGNPPFDLPALAGWFQNTFLDPQNQNRSASNEDGDFSPAADVFSTGEAFIVHVSLPGALKQDIALNWNAETSTLIISGVITRPDLGIEDLVTITGERQVGAFERKISLGQADDFVKVDEDGITAKLEDGILKVEVPKVQKEDDFVQVKRVDIQ